jgi:hypothetical protein
MHSPKPPSRATTMVELFERLLNFRTVEGYQRGLAFQPRPTDVFISPAAKCGTTWTQQIVHGLRTRGDMDFDEITAVTPWLEMAHDLGLDLENPHPAHPRTYKSHLSWHDIPKGGRYIVPIRDPKDALVSLYRFFEGWWFEPGAISIETFAREWYLASRETGSYWYHLISWWEQRENENVLLLCYEDMQADLPGAIRTIAGFISVELDDELLDIVVRQSSYPFMKAHQRQFDEHLVANIRGPLCDLPPGDSSKVRNGRVGDHRYELSGEIREEMDAIWREEIGARLGLDSYEALRAELA